MSKFWKMLLPSTFDCEECFDTGHLYNGYGVALECFFCEVVA